MNSNDYSQKSTPPPPQPEYGQYATGFPVDLQPMGAAPTQWSSGLCDCLDDVPTCCLTFWCPCITFGRMAEFMDKGSTSCAVHGVLYTLLAIATGCQCIYSCMYRSKMRQQYMLPEEPCNDCLIHCCCESCAMCQEYRELQSRGIDMSLGWQGNMERQQNYGVVMPPVAPGGMKR